MSKELKVFEELSKIKVDTKKKGKFDYISWATAWKHVKQLYPSANFIIYTTESGYPAFVNKNIEKGGFVKVGVIIEEIEHIEYYPILNFNNSSIPNTMITSFDINKAIKRALSKAISMHGLGLHLYDGEEFKE